MLMPLAIEAPNRALELDREQDNPACPETMSARVRDRERQAPGTTEQIHLVELQSRNQFLAEVAELLERVNLTTLKTAEWNMVFSRLVLTKQPEREQFPFTQNHIEDREHNRGVSSSLAETSPTSTTTGRAAPVSGRAGARPGAAHYSVAGEATIALEDSTRLDVRYNVKPSSFYKVGRVFVVLWHEPFSSLPGNSQSVSRNTYTSERNVPVSTGPYGEPIYTTPRRMVVVREDHGHCVCVQINTYGGRGLKKFRQIPAAVEAHSIIYMDGTEARWLEGEPPSSKRHIAVRRANQGQRLDPASRVCYSRPHTVEHTVKAMDVGMVTRDCVPHLLGYYEAQNRVS
ncbi:hypothetical protein A1O1_06636 [Capronia coronata CBS 617.96]|uniref:DUF6590 domain-containing protein n=1 Tax=Capronia coronata CBS 617.96 TaxID=1182541 RepID=W9YAG7_9EURO|nr:uncharacterized protein A1O1_06636 [Capronia coronata CBS 617.96]EXJ86266.1 hypothetical protein A1O1_06636 [Capronia coronata CBS 617.96]